MRCAGIDRGTAMHGRNDEVILAVKLERRAVSREGRCPNRNSLITGPWRRQLFTIFFAWYFQILVSIWADLGEIVNNCDVWDIFRYASHPNWKRLIIVFSVLVLVQWVCWNKEKQVLDFIYRHRLLLSTAAVAILVLFNISGSSVHILSSYVKTDAETREAPCQD